MRRCDVCFGRKRCAEEGCFLLGQSTNLHVLWVDVFWKEGNALINIFFE
jgi:hypothetical protein